MLGVVRESVLALHEASYLLAELNEPRVGGIEGAPLVQRIDALFADVPWSVEIRLSDAERDDVRYLVGNVKEAAYT